MSKENRKKSKVSRVLKVAGTAGIVLGAATVDTNVVFAAEAGSEGVNSQLPESDSAAWSDFQNTGMSETAYENPIDSQTISGNESETKNGSGSELETGSENENKSESGG